MEDLPVWLQNLLRSNEVIAALIAFGLAALWELLQRKLAPRGRLLWAISHEYIFLVPPQVQIAPPEPVPAAEGSHEVAPTEPQPVREPGLIRTREIWVQNGGRAPVHDVEVVLNWRPHHYQIWPQRNFTEQVNPAGLLVIGVPTLGHREFFTIAIIDVRELPNVANVRSSDGVARQVTMGPQQVQPRWKLEILRAVLFIGAFSIIYWLIRLVRGL